jgi:signal transduction histidine kinase
MGDVTTVPSDPGRFDRRRAGVLLASNHGTFLAMATSVVIAVVLYPHDHRGTVVWLVIRLTLSVGMVVAFGRMQRLGAAEPRRVIDTYAAIVAVGGIGWGLLPVLVRPADPEWQSILLFALIGNLSIVAAGGAPDRRVFIAGASPVLAIGLPAFASFDGNFSFILALLLLLAGLYSWAVSENSNRVLESTFAADLRNEVLVRELEEHRADLHEINQRLHEMVERQSMTLEERNALMAAVSHDLRSPLAAIALLAQTLEQRGTAMTDEQRHDLAARISADARHTVEVLADLASARRLQGHDVSVDRAELDIDVLMQAAVSAHRTDDQQLSVRPFDDGRPVVADRVLVARVLDNLVANAVKHTPPGSSIVVGATRVDDDVLVFVDDDGPGLPEAMAETVFDAYVRGTSSTVRPGSGVGLFLVRTFATLQGGEAWWEPSAAGGSRFVVSIPQGERPTVG